MDASSTKRESTGLCALSCPAKPKTLELSEVDTPVVVIVELKKDRLHCTGRMHVGWHVTDAASSGASGIANSSGSGELPSQERAGGQAGGRAEG